MFHNLKGYDSHFIIQELDKKKISYVKDGKERVSKIDLIAKNDEKFVCFSFKKLRFIDSAAHLSDKLSNLVDNLKNDNVKHFKHISKFFPDERQRKLLLRKGVYPYEWADSFEKFKHTNIPTQTEFYDSLNEEVCSDEDYQHAQTVWNEFGMKTLISCTTSCPLKGKLVNKS